MILPHLIMIPQHILNQMAQRVVNPPINEKGEKLGVQDTYELVRQALLANHEARRLEEMWKRS